MPQRNYLNSTAEIARPPRGVNGEVGEEVVEVVEVEEEEEEEALALGVEGRN